MFKPVTFLKQATLNLFALTLVLAVTAPVTLTLAAGPSSLEADLLKANILPKNYAFRVTQNGGDAIVQTYERPSALDNDVKIDAVLIARVITEKLPAVAKVKTLFFRLDRTSYKQVTVTVGDVAAFGAGDISKEKLLQSLEVQKIATGEAAPGVAKPGFFKSGGLSFSYPANWTFVPSNHPESLGELIIPGYNEWATVKISRQSSASPEAQSAYDAQFSLKHNFKIARQGATVVGVRAMPAFQLLTSGCEEQHKDKIRLQQHVYFGEPGAIYGLALQYSPADGQKLTSQFIKLLGTVVTARQ